MGLLDGKVAIVTARVAGSVRLRQLFAREGASVVNQRPRRPRDGSGSTSRWRRRWSMRSRKRAARGRQRSDISTSPAGNRCSTTPSRIWPRDILVNNAGILLDETFAKPKANWQVIRVHLKGPSAAPSRCSMDARERRGVIVNTSSTSGLIGISADQLWRRQGVSGTVELLAMSRNTTSDLNAGPGA